MELNGDILEMFLEGVIHYGGRLLIAIIAFIIGRLMIRLFLNRLEKRIEKKLDPTLHSFISSLTKTFFYLLLLIILASTLGLEMSSLVALLGAAGLAVGLSLQGSLANFAGGVLILVFRPFDVGDFIETPDHKGTIKQIQILYTTLQTRDNKIIVIPNGQLANNSTVNYTKSNTRRVELSIGTGYEEEISHVKKVIKKVVESHQLILQEPEPTIRLAEHAPSSINYNVYVWTENKNYWNVYYDLMENIKTAFDEEDIAIPYPQMDIHLKQTDNN